MSHIKLFPDRLALWTLSSVTDEATGHEKEYMLDTRKITYWEANSTGQKDIDIDLGSGYGDILPDAVMLCCYLSNSVINPILVYADSNDDYSTMSQISGIEENLETGWQFIPIVFSTPNQNYRYWRIRFSASLTSAVKVSELYIGREYEISVNINYNDERGVDYSGVSLNESRSGVRSADLTTPPRGYDIIAWDLLDKTNKEKIDEVMSITKGRRYPLFMIDSDGDTRFGRITNKKLGAIRTHDGIYSIPGLTFEDELGSAD